MLKKWHVEMNV